MKIEWKLKQVMDSEGIRPIDLWKAMSPRGSQMTAYRWYNSPPSTVSLETLGRVLSALERIAGHQYTVEDILSPVEETAEITV